MRSLSEHFLSANAYAGLRFHCTTPPESSIRQCVPAHSLISTLRQTHAVAYLVLLLYAQRKSMSMKFLKTIFDENRVPTWDRITVLSMVIYNYFVTTILYSQHPGSRTMSPFFISERLILHGKNALRYGRKVMP